ncbi:MAG: hypothetical protein LBF15_03110 [Candidatus Peribacteria bacterium]|jgi:hypothetical protein|nr:hypothetical protein [Candidatus Peribacteria bacterium]
MKSSIDFSNSPKGFITNNKYQPDLNKYLLYENNIKIEKDDILILSTDAIANRIFKQVEY